MFLLLVGGHSNSSRKLCIASVLLYVLFRNLNDFQFQFDAFKDDAKVVQVDGQPSSARRTSIFVNMSNASTRTLLIPVIRTDMYAQNTTNTTTAATTTTSPSATPTRPGDEQAVLNMWYLWCVLDDNNTVLFDHFPHTSQSLLPCWSWFQRMQEQKGDDEQMAHTGTTASSNMSCGFYLKSPHLKLNSWAEQLIQVMGCSVTRDSPSNTNVSNTILHYVDPTVVRRFRWYEKPSDAAALRSRLLEERRHRIQQNGTTWTNPTHSPNDSRMMIAIVNRQVRRRIVNCDNITTALQLAFPSAQIQIVYMEGMQPWEQFVFWSQQCIVIAPHGAGLTNAIFLPPGNASAVIEVFPHHYYPAFYFGNLLGSCGIRRYGYYNNESNPEADFAVYGATPENRSQYKHQDMEPPVDAIVDLVRQAMMMMMDGSIEQRNTIAATK